MEQNPLAEKSTGLEEQALTQRANERTGFFWTKIWGLLTEPNDAIQQPDERRQAQLLATLLVTLTPVGLLLTVLPHILNDSSGFFHQPVFYIVLIAIVLAFISYGLSRSPRYKMGSVVLVLSISWVAFAIPLTGSQAYQLEMVSDLIIAALLSGILLPVRVTMVLTGLQLVGLALLPSVSSNFVWNDLMWERLGFVTFVSVTNLLITRYRDLLENDRRAALHKRYAELEKMHADLEQQAAERTAELQRLSADLEREIADHQFAERVINETYGQLEQKIAERTTELSNANTLLQEQIDERVRAEAAEREQRILAEGLRDTAAAINSIFDLHEILDRILIYIERILPYDSASIMMIDAGVAYIVHGRGFDKYGHNMDEILSVRLPIAEYHNLKTMFDTGRPVIVADTEEDPAWHGIEATRWIRSTVGAPIRIEGNVIGFVNLDSHLPNAFNESFAEKLLAFTDQASIAIRNANLFDAIRQHAAELETRVTERTAELEREQAQLHAIMNSINEGLFSQIRVVGESTYFNAALLRMTGYGAEEWDLTQLNPTTMSKSEFMDWLQAIREHVLSHGSWQGELRLRRKDGSEFDALLISSRINNQDEQMIGSVTIIRDISQEKALQEQKSRFVANASHELRTPLTNLITRLYLLRKQPDHLQEHLDILDRVATRMRNLVEDLLDFSRFERGVILLKTRNVDARDLINEVVQVQQQEAEKKKIDLSTYMPAEPMMIMADPERMNQAITNLVINAIYYTPDEGKIRIQLLTESDDAGKEWAVIHIRDNGPGIPAKLLPNLFLPFYRGSENTKGTGLGLTIAQEIAERHGGYISIESEAEKGSDFIIHLPFAAEES